MRASSDFHKISIPINPCRHKVGLMPQYKHNDGPINICQRVGHELKAITLSPKLLNNVPIHVKKTSVPGDGVKF